MPDEGKNKQKRPEPGSPEARREALLWWVWLAVGLILGAAAKYFLTRR